MICKSLRIGLLLCAALLGSLIRLAAPAHAFVERPIEPINAFLLSSLPADYPSLEKYIAQLKEGGANTVILDLSQPEASAPLPGLLPNLVYTVHQAGMKLFVVAPTRNNPAALAAHPEWEDSRFDLGSGTLQPTGKLDLFNPEAVDFLAGYIKEIASYYVDGVLLDDDFHYLNVEGMSDRALNAYRDATGTAVVPGKIFLEVQPDRTGYGVKTYGEAYQPWVEFKRDRLVEVFQALMKPALMTSGRLKFGAPIHLVLPMMTPIELLQHYAYDMQSLRKLDIDYYWISIRFRDIRAEQRLTYRQTMELIARISTSSVTFSKDPGKALVLMQTMLPNGRQLPLSEIEEVASLVRKSGDPGIGFEVSTGVRLPAALTKKVFRRDK